MLEKIEALLQEIEALTAQSLDDVEQPVELSDMGKDYDADSILTNLMLAFLTAMAVLLVLNRSHLLIKRLFFKKKASNN